MDEIEAQKQEWEQGELKKYLGSAPELKEEFGTRRERIPAKVMYSPAELNQIGFNYLKDLSFPGLYPFTRGTSPSMYRSKLWSMSQVTGFGSGEDANKRWRYLLDHGLSGLLIELDLPTQVGLDSDDPMSTGEVGRLGVAVDTLDDLERALDLDMDKIKYLYIIASAMAPVLTAMVTTLFEKKGISTNDFVLTVQNEILKEFVCRGSYVFPPGASMRLAADVIEFMVRQQPNWKPISICGAHLGSSGASCSQEVGFALSFAFSYLESALKRGLTVDEVAPRFDFLFCAHMDLFEEVAKIRAARKVWARMIKERFGAKDERSMAARCLVDASGITLTSQQPLNNIARLTIQGLACVLSGADYVVVPSYDEAMAIPSQDAVRVSAAIQNIIAFESGVRNTVDPLGGSYYVEYLTKTIEDEALKVITKIDSMGGAVAAVESGYVQRELADSAYRWQLDVESGKTTIIGINKLKVEDEKPLEIFRVEPGVEQRQIERLKKARQSRDAGRVKESLRNVKAAAQADVNLIAPLQEAAKAYATIGEIRNTLTDVFGEYHEKAAGLV